MEEHECQNCSKNKIEDSDMDLEERIEYGLCFDCWNSPDWMEERNILNDVEW